MNAQDKVVKYGQEQLLSFASELSDEERQALYSQIETLDFDVIAQGEAYKAAPRGKITPLEALDIQRIGLRRQEYEEAGLKAIKEGKVAAVLLAGGMGTRLGCDGPKGIYDIGITRRLYIFECLINNLTDVVNKAGAYIDLCVMTSDLNHEATVSFFKEHDYFGYPSENICFFRQEMAPCCDLEGKILLESKGKVATSPNGNGGWYLSMMRAGIADRLRTKDIEYLNVFAVDNVLQRICDPVFIGATILENKEVGAKVVRKNHPEEKVGVMCLEDGHPSIVEYYDLTDSMRDEVDERGERVYNFGVILNYLFKVDSLTKIVNKALPYHVVLKKVPYVSKTGEQVHPETPNGHKFEQLILDMIYLSKSCLPFEVEREREFAPIKNLTGVDSVESARELLKKNGVEL
ncbi:MAG: UDPGP type 1 family protein [Lachnospiraceae bacterium]|nr:UDPGP type 1 family protein [Lachnospiraceae bacterium]